MAEPKKTADLVAASLGALARHEEQQAALAGEATRPPAPGDVYLLKETKDYSVEWVLIARDPADPDRFLAVPADGNFLAGSADVELPDDSAVGALKLRCGWATWIKAQRLAPDLRVGAVGPADVSQARQKWFDVGDGEVTGSVLAREVDDDPEYQEWLEEVVIAARRKLLEAEVPVRTKKEHDARVPEDTANDNDAGVSPRPAEDSGKAVIIPLRRRPPPTFYRLAASIALAVTGGLAGLQLWRFNDQVRNLETANRSAEERHREEVQGLETERERLVARHQRELESAGQEHAQAARQLREQITELDERLEVATRASSVVNPVIAFFDPPRVATRGKKKITLQPGASHVVLFLTLEERSAAQKYRLELREKGSGVPVWTNDRLTVMEPAEIRVGVPAGILNPGVYELELSALEGGKVRRVGEYELEVSG